MAAMQDAPFTWSVQHDAVSGVTDGILSRCAASRSCPEIFQTVSSNEYWNQRMSLDTTDGAERDLEERYGSHEGYVAAVENAAVEEVKSGFLLPEDADRLIAEARASSVLK